MTWPQWVMAILFGTSVVAGLALDGEPRTGKQNGAMTIVILAFEAWVLHMGGFW